MKTETLENKIQTPGLGEMFDSEVNSGVAYSSKVASFIENLKVPTTKDDKPDISKLIEQLISGTKEIVKSLNPDHKDPQWVPDYEALSNIFKTYGRILQDDKLRKEVRDAVINAYVTTAQNYIISRQQGRVTRVPIEEGKKFGEEIATETSNKALVPLINSATTPNEVAGRVSAVLNDVYGKRQQGYGLHGSFDYLKAKPNPLPNVSEHVGAQAKAYSQKHQS